MNVVEPGVIEGIDANGALVGFRPEHVEVGEASGDAVAISALVEVVEYLGDEQLLHLRVGDTPLLAKISIDHAVVPLGERMFTVAREKIHLFDADSERALAVRSAA
jgi:multiple sugar transport system ATP-binding protein